jgi:hypothetical protein
VSVGTAQVANGDSIASQYRMCRIRSGDRLTSLLLFCNAITSAAANVGLYRSTVARSSVPRCSPPPSPSPPPRTPASSWCTR